MTERATVKAKIRISHKLFMFYSSWSSVSSRLQPSRSYQERMTSFYSATHSLIGFHDSAQDADNTQTAPAFVVCTRNCKIRITCDRGIVTQEKKHSIVFPATARILMLLVYNLQERFERSLLNHTRHDLKMLLNTAWQANRQRNFVKKCGYPEEITFPHETRRWLRLGLDLKGCQLCKLSRQLSPLCFVIKICFVSHLRFNRRYRWQTVARVTRRNLSNFCLSRSKFSVSQCCYSISC